MANELLKNIPNINSLLESETGTDAVHQYGRNVFLYAVKKILNKLRTALLANEPVTFSRDSILEQALSLVKQIYSPTLKPVINATGTVIHTNLGRSPLSESVFESLRDTAGYTNIEFNLNAGRRGHRSYHAKEALRYITGAEDCAIVNNNAAAVLLLLQTFAMGKEVIISRGELVEVGGGFRIPSIMSSSGANLVEVGCTNKTRLADYEEAITEDTAVIFKVHHSNFKMTGFVEETSVSELVQLCNKHNILLIYDLGSGLLRKPELLKEIPEDDVQSAVKAGVDLVCFSTDKLMGGPQGGVICGKQELVQKCEKHPLMRSLRVGKMTYSALSAVCRDYLSDETLLKNNPLFSILSQSNDTVLARAELLSRGINDAQNDTVAEVVSCASQVGGGTLPDFFIDSWSVKIRSPFNTVKERERFSEALFHDLMKQEKPIVSILKEGHVYFDCFTIRDEQIDDIVEAVATLL